MPSKILKARYRTTAAFIFAAMSFGVCAASAAVVISDKATQNMSCSAGVCTPTAAKANLNVTDLANLLASGDVKVVSDSAARDIEFKAPLSWTSASRLTLDSYRAIAFAQPISVTGTGGLTITTNDGGHNGDFAFEKKGHVKFWDLSSSLVINGASYTLVKQIKQLANAIAANPSGQYALAGSYNASKDGTYSQSPTPAFGGTLEGLGNTLSNYVISDPTDSARVGLISEIGCCAAIVRDLIVNGASVTGDRAI